MIRRPEIGKLAFRYQVPERTIQKDYIITRVLRELAPAMATVGLRFKGGTCLKKCFFAEYRFSEDLDFTLEQPAISDQAYAELDSVAGRLTADGLTLALGDPIVRATGRTYHAAVTGPLGSGDKLKIDITSPELLVFDAVDKPLLDEYSDAQAPVRVRCYALEEIFLEKLVCLLDPKRIQPRDLYDLVSLSNDGVVDVEAACWQFGEKARFKRLDPSGLREALDRKSARLKRAWETQLSEQLPPESLPGYEDSERRVLRLLKQYGLVG
jgi:predicted nucleotidyltransferase component of viral defense system